MGVFNIIETFFFISLAITFILILLIVNHFKQRINSIEQKCDTMFEIINNIIQDFGNIKRMQTFNMHMGKTISKSTPEFFMENVESIENDRSIEVLDIKSKIIVSDDEYENIDTKNNDEDDSEEDDSEVETDYESEDEDESDDDSEVENYVKGYDNDKTNEKINIDIFNNPQSNKIINLDEDIKIVEKTHLEENVNDIIQVEKIEPLEPLESIETIENIEIIQNVTEEKFKDVYNKMTSQELKRIVITKGLCSDPSKMKKNELLKMLDIE